MSGSVPPPAPPPAAPAPTPQTPATLAEVTVAKVPDRLAVLPRPVVLSGTVAGTGPDGMVRVRTQAGEIQVKSPVPLPTDKPVTLQIAAGQPPGRAVVFTAPPPAAAAPAAPPAATAPQPGVVLSLLSNALTLAGAPLAARPTLAPGALVPATVIAAATAPPAAPQAPPAAGPAGAAIPNTAPGAMPAPPPPAAAGSAPAMPGAGQPAAQPAAAPATPSAGIPAAGIPTAASPPAGTSPAAPIATAPAAPAPPATGPVLPVPVPSAPALPQGGAVPAAPLPPSGAAAAPGSSAQPPQPGAGADAPTATPAAARAAPPPPAAPAPLLAQGATVALRVLSVIPPGGDPGPGIAAALAADGPTVGGTVAGATSRGQPILATPQGMLALNTRAVLPPGTQVTAVVGDPAAALAGLSLEGEAALPGREWPTLRETLAVLAALDPGIARTVMNSIVPQPNRKLGAALSFFLAAVRGGSARGWLGDEAATALERGGRGDLLARLDREFRGLRNQAAEPAPGDWRPYTVPMFDGQALAPLQLHVRPLHQDDEGQGAAADDKDRGSRFLIEVELSRLGPLQLDGMVREGRFDLILRSANPLPSPLRGELLDVFTDSLEAVGYGGGLTFQVGAKAWVKLARSGRSTTVTA